MKNSNLEMYLDGAYSLFSLIYRPAGAEDFRGLWDTVYLDMAYFRSASDRDEDDDEYLRDCLDRFDPFTDYSDDIHPDMPDRGLFSRLWGCSHPRLFSKITGFNRSTSIHISRGPPGDARRRRPHTQREGHKHHQEIVDEAVQRLVISTEERIQYPNNSGTETQVHCLNSQADLVLDSKAVRGRYYYITLWILCSIIQCGLHP